MDVVQRQPRAVWYRCSGTVRRCSHCNHLLPVPFLPSRYPVVLCRTVQTSRRTMSAYCLESICGSVFMPTNSSRGSFSSAAQTFVRPSRGFGAAAVRNKASDNCRTPTGKMHARDVSPGITRCAVLSAMNDISMPHHIDFLVSNCRTLWYDVMCD